MKSNKKAKNKTTWLEALADLASKNWMRFFLFDLDWTNRFKKKVQIKIDWNPIRNKERKFAENKGCPNKNWPDCLCLKNTEILKLLQT
jgi:hypothetical protein